MAQIHIAGHSKVQKYILDTHDHPVIDPVWKIYEHAIRRIGPTATLLEWDDSIPSFEEVHAEARKAEKYIPLPRRQAYDTAPITAANDGGRDAAAHNADGIAPKTEDRRPMRVEAAEFIRPNSRLTSIERLEIYSRSYWFRALDSLADDFPGLRAVLGRRAFNRLSRAYLADCPSRSFTLRDLGERLAGWLQRHPRYAGKTFSLALDMVRLEWAHIEAFDSAAEKALGPEDLIQLGPDLRAGLQPYIRLLEFEYPVDKLLIQANGASEEHEEASNAVLKQKHQGAARRAIHLKRERTHLAVHRMDFTVDYQVSPLKSFGFSTRFVKGSPSGMPFSPESRTAPRRSMNSGDCWRHGLLRGPNWAGCARQRESRKRG